MAAGWILFSVLLTLNFVANKQTIYLSSFESTRSTYCNLSKDASYETESHNCGEENGSKFMFFIRILSPVALHWLCCMQHLELVATTMKPANDNLPNVPVRSVS